MFTLLIHRTSVCPVGHDAGIAGFVLGVPRCGPLLAGGVDGGVVVKVFAGVGACGVLAAGAFSPCSLFFSTLAFVVLPLVPWVLAVLAFPAYGSPVFGKAE